MDCSVEERVSQKVKTWDWEAEEYVERRAAREVGVNDDMVCFRSRGLVTIRRWEC